MKTKPGRENGSRERFDWFGPRFVSSETHAKAPELDCLVEIARPDTGWVILDIATGGGHTGPAFAPHVRLVIATDISAGMLSAAREFILGRGTRDVLFSFAQSERLPFLTSSFELVTCQIAAHLFSDVNQFAADCARLLRPGGSPLIQDQCLPENLAAARYIDRFERLRDPSHRRFFSASEWEGIYKQAGLSGTHREIVEKKSILNPGRSARIARTW
jgi:ubiquinone/menaquinone biosynthesis C-methylase UbiE